MLENTARPSAEPDPFTHGCGLIQAAKAYELLLATATQPLQDVRYKVCQRAPVGQSGARPDD